jgi:hypothetical protein
MLPNAIRKCKASDFWYTSDALQSTFCNEYFDGEEKNRKRPSSENRGGHIMDGKVGKTCHGDIP